MIKLAITHFIVDFVLQSREMGKKKSIEFKWLAAHLGIQFMGFLWMGWKFTLVNALIHGIIDWYIWKLYKYSVLYRNKISFKNLSRFNPLKDLSKYKYWEDHLFYTTIGFDQMLHFLTLIVLYNLGL